jgi:reverse gyrase
MDWKHMSQTERLICKLTGDPFLFHVAIMGYDPLPLQGEWLHSYARDERCMIMAPVGHGKSITTDVSFPLWMYFRDCNVRNGLVSATDELVKGSMSEIEHHLIENEVFKAVFDARWGHVPYPDRVAGVQPRWSLLEKVCYRTRPIGVKDCTFFGVGLFGSMFGLRFDVIIMDDVIDPKLYMTRNIDITEKVRRQVEANIFTRLTLGSETERQIKMIGTFEDDADYYHYVIDEYWQTWQIWLYRAIRRKGQSHRINITKCQHDVAKQRENGLNVDDIDIMCETGL